MNPPQTGPNIYPTLPLIQNPQYPHPFPSQARHNNYIPPAQYGDIQAQNPKERERQEVVGRIAETEKSLDSCFIKFYQVWLWLEPIVFLVAAFSRPGKFVFAFLGKYESIVICLLWIGVQNVYGLLAISQKSIKKANILCWMVTLALIPSLYADIYLSAVLIAAELQNPDYESLWFYYMIFFIIVCSVVVLVHVIFSMIGAFKVRKILVKRELLQENLNEIDYSLRA